MILRNLESWLQIKDMTDIDLARKTKLSAPYVRAVIGGYNVPEQIARRIARVLDTTPAELEGREEEDKSKSITNQEIWDSLQDLHKKIDELLG